MKKILTVLFFVICFLSLRSYALSEDKNEDISLELEKQISIQKRINEIGINILNLNKIQKRVVFLYDEKEKKKFLRLDKTYTKRQVVLYDEFYKTLESDDEIAGVLSREIYLALRTFDGIFNGRLDTAETVLGSKKFEVTADKRAVDLMVKAGYNPLALIVYINKTYPQKRSDFISRHNLTSKRLAHLFEYITFKYPQFLEKNKENEEFLNNKYYQNFLLTSVENRKKLEQKIKNNSKENINYE